MLLKPKRKAAVAGNFVQVLRSVVQLADSVFLPFKTDLSVRISQNFDDYKKLVTVVKKLCGPAYAANLSNRDLCELAQALSKLWRYKEKFADGKGIS